jgi:hypothetical protein
MLTKTKVLNLLIVFSLTVFAIVMSFGNLSRVQALSDNFMQHGRIAAAITVPSGGSYSSIRNSGTGGEVHHMPAFNSFNGEVKLTHGKGPAIWMTVEHHRKTASWGSGTQAKQYRATQKLLIKQGKFKEAMDLDVKDVTDKFDGVYDAAIKQAYAYYATIATSTVPQIVPPDTTTFDVDQPN